MLSYIIDDLQPLSHPVSLNYSAEFGTVFQVTCSMKPYLPRLPVGVRGIAYLYCIASFIEDKETFKKILVHISLWETRNHDMPPRKSKMQKYIPDLSEIKETVYDDFSQLIPLNDYYSQVAEEQLP